MNPAISQSARAAKVVQNRPVERSLDIQSIVNPHASEIVALLGTLVVGLAIWQLGESYYDIANILIPLSLMVNMAVGILRLTQRSLTTIWTPVLWIRAAIFFYAGFGSLVPLFVNNANLNYIEAFFLFYSSDLIKFNIVSLLFITSMLTSIPAFSLFLNLRYQDRSQLRIFRFPPPAISFAAVAIAFLSISTAVNVFFIFPFQFGLIEGTYPAILAEVGQASLIGIFLTLVWALREKPTFVPVVLVIAMFYSFAGLLSLSKGPILFPIIMVGLGYFYVKPTVFRIAAVSLIAITVFLFSQSIVDYGRYSITQLYGSHDAPVGAAERFDIISSYFDDAQSFSQESEINSGTLRFSYVNVGTFAIYLYDSGEPGNTYENAPWIFVPRAIYPDKPIITDIARNLNFAATGSLDSSVATGLAAEAYWNGGWIATIALGVLMGFILWIWSLYAVQVQLRGAWHLFVIVLVGARIGSRYDGFFITDVLGPVVFAIIGHLILTWGNAALTMRSVRS